MPSSNTPPPILDGARLLVYAVIDDSVIYNSRSTLYVDGKLLGAVPRLAIGQPSDTEQVLLFFCDEKWNSLGMVECTSLADAQKRAESEYHGISKNWVDANASDEEAARYEEEQYLEKHCSFCGKSPDEAQQMITASVACICDDCIREFYQNLTR